MATCTIVPVATEAEFNEAIKSLPSSCLTVIYFHAPWAEPCKQMSTILSTLASTYEQTTPPRIQFLSLDAEEVSDVSERYDVTQVPLVVMQKGGKTMEAVTGTDAAKVRAAVERHYDSGENKAGLPPRQVVTRPADPGETEGAPYANGNGTTNGDVPADEPQDINERLKDLVRAAPVMLFMKGTPSAPQCGFSRQTVALLREKGVKYGFFNILADDEVRQGLKSFSDWPTFPQLYVEGDLVGGLDIVKEEFENDEDFLKSFSIHAEGVKA
jgi:Grx4 family monothiol glutaredoxin